jgi:hypothetical protein
MSKKNNKIKKTNIDNPHYAFDYSNFATSGSVVPNSTVFESLNKTYFENRELENWRSSNKLNRSFLISSGILADWIEEVNKERPTTDTVTLMALAEKVEHLSKRQNATDAHFTDEIDSLKERINESEAKRTQSKIEEIQILLKENVETLTEIGDFKDNWNQYGAKKFNDSLIIKCIKFVTKLELNYQPEIFPTAQNSIQFEFKPDIDHILQFEFFINRISLYKRIGSIKITNENISETQALDEIKKFQQEFRNRKLGVFV